jgi:hypothetical protein
MGQPCSPVAAAAVSARDAVPSVLPAIAAGGKPAIDLLFRACEAALTKARLTGRAIMYQCDGREVRTH